MGLKQHDMTMRIGISRQQYQRLESKGNPRLDTLELIAKGLNSELLLVPHEKVNAVRALLAEGEDGSTKVSQLENKNTKLLTEDPWQGLLGESE